MITYCFFVLLIGLMLTLPALAKEPVSITIDADHARFELSDLMLGANMEDLHYQMTGGLSSQLIHGESFFEPTPTEIARQCQPFESFTVRGGVWRLKDAELSVFITGVPSDASSVPTAAGVVKKGVGARLSTEIASSPNMAQTSLEIKFPQAASGAAGLALHIQPNEADELWEWFSGYTIALEPKTQTVTLKKAVRANQHVELKTSPCVIPLETWISVVVQIVGKHIAIQIDGHDILDCEDESPLPAGKMGLLAQENVSFRHLMETSSDGKSYPIVFTPNPLLATPGDAVSLRWRKVQTGMAQGNFTHNTDSGSWLAGKPSQEIRFSAGTGEFGIDNAGLCRWGICLVKGKTYEGFLRLKGARGTEVFVSLRSADGRQIYAVKPLRLSGSNDEYERIAFDLTPTRDDADGRFAITLRRPGAVTVGYAFLQPGPWGRYKDLPIRRDIAEAVIAQGIHVLRMNGGMIERPDYRWANMQGPRDLRPPYDGFYDRWCSNGFGLIEFLQFCDAAGLVPIPALNRDETPEAVADFVAYATASVQTPAGQRRANDGHPAPFPLPYYQLANESQLDAHYVEQFKKVAEAVWKIAPNITFVTTSDPVSVKEGDDETSVRQKLALQLELVRFAQEHGKKILFDCHSFSGSAIPNIARFARWIKQLSASPDDVSTAILELNAGSFDFARGLAHASELNAAYRAGDVIRGIGMPNLSQPWHVYQTDWKAVLWTQGNIYYTQSKVWYQPAYYVDQMVARSWVSQTLPSTVQSSGGDLDVFAGRSEDGKKLVLRVVNRAAESTDAEIILIGFSPTDPSAQIEELTGEPREFNTLEQPEKIKPRSHMWLHRTRDGKIRYSFPPHSFTVITLI